MAWTTYWIRQPYRVFRETGQCVVTCPREFFGYEFSPNQDITTAKPREHFPNWYVDSFHPWVYTPFPFSASRSYFKVLQPWNMVAMSLVYYERVRLTAFKVRDHQELGLPRCLLTLPQARFEHTPCRWQPRRQQLISSLPYFMDCLDVTWMVGSEIFSWKYRTENNSATFGHENFMVKDKMGDTCVDERIILKWVFNLMWIQATWPI